MAYVKLTRMAASAALALALTAVPAAAHVGIHGRVRTICRADIEPAEARPAQTGEVLLGRVSRLCNDVAGYRLTLEHPSDLAEAWFMFDGRRVPISAGSSSTLLLDSRNPGVGVSDLTIGLSRPAALSGLVLRIEPNGPIF